jgi:hypothetical protein
MRRFSLSSLLAAGGAPEPKWIWAAGEEPAPKNRFTWFRKVVELTAIPENADVLFAADSNAHLWINGQPLRRKVTRSHEARITAEVVDAAPALRIGRNTVVVLHHNWGAITTFQRDANKHAGLWIGGAWLGTDESWKAIAAPEFQRHEQQVKGVIKHARIRYPVIVDGRKAFRGDMHSAAFDDSSWPTAVVVRDGPWPAAAPKPVETRAQREWPCYPPGITAAGVLTPAQPISADPLSIAAGIRTARYTPDADLLAQARRQFHRAPAVIKAKAGESRYITFDFQQPVHGFPFVDLEQAPAGTVVDLGYGELSYSQYLGEKHVETSGWLNPEGVVGPGYADRYITRAGAQRIEFPDERTARWFSVQFHFAEDGEVVLREAGIVRSQYPLLPAGCFYCGDERIEQFVKLGRIHAEITMSDGYVDTPGREDGQWIEDSRVRALITSRWFGDEQLRRMMIRVHAESTRGDGGFHAFPPSNYPAYPVGYDWAVQWAAMLYDDYMWSGSTELIERYWNVLKSFWENALAKVDANGVWRTNRVFADIRVGAHPANDKQSSGIVTAFMIERLRWSAEMARAAGHGEQAAAWLATADRMSAAFRKFHVVAARDGVPVHVGDRLDPENATVERGFSQAGQVNAVLAGLLSGTDAHAVLDYVFPAPNGAPPAGVTRWNNPTFAYRSLRALSDNGMAARAVAHMVERYSPYLPGNPRNRVAPELQGPLGGPLPEYWVSREDLKLGPGEKNTAQPADETGSHGWGAVPMLWLHESLLGVRIVAPGGVKLRIAPESGGLAYVTGQTRTPRGPVWVDWQAAAKTLDVELPAGVEAELVLPAELAGRRLNVPKGAKRVGPGRYRLNGAGWFRFE